MGIYFLGITFILFVISLSYGNALAYTCTFIFVSIIMTSATYTHFNLKNIRVQSMTGAQNIFEDEPFRLNVSVSHQDRKKKYDITIRSTSSYSEVVGIESIQKSEPKDLVLINKSLKRGQYFFSRVTLTTSFPFGLFYSWTYANKMNKFFVYPARIGGLPLPEKKIFNESEGSSKNSGFSDFREHVKHEQGMPYNHVDWKLYAKGKGMYLKTFESQASSHYHFSLKQVANLPIESRLSQIAVWMLQANQSRAYWGLDLNGELTQTATGDDHLKTCLKMLAEYRTEEQEIVL